MLLLTPAADSFGRVGFFHLIGIFSFSFSSSPPLEKVQSPGGITSAAAASAAPLVKEGEK